MTLLCFVLFLLAGMANFAFTLAIFRALLKAEVPVSFFELRWQIHKHLKTYKGICREQSGKIGFPYYGYVVSLVLLIVLGLLAFASLGVRH